MINDGTILIPSSFEGLEGANVYINGGTVDLVSQDDGINAAGGSDSASTEPGRMDTFGGSGNNVLEINGGKVTVDSSGDGLDSNGALNLNGGEVIVNGPENGADASLDFDGSNVITGGSIIAAGSSGMMTMPDASSTQATLAVVFTNTQGVNSQISINDSQGKEIVSFTSVKQYQSVVISNPLLILGETYTILQDGLALFDTTLDTTVTMVDESGAVTTGRGGGFGPGGNNTRPTR